MRALDIAATGMSAQQMRVEVISNNLANMSTTGYNARRAEFADLHYQQIQPPGAVNASDGSLVPTGIQLGLGVRPAAVTVMPAQGTLLSSGGDLDFAIDGIGFLEVTLPSGQSGYTRDGSLKRSPDGLIVTSDGNEVVPGITIPPDARSISVNAQGEVYAYFNDRVDAQLLGQFTLASFTNERACRQPARTIFSRRLPLAHQLLLFPDKVASAHCDRAIWRKVRSIRSKRSPT
jgi:flagellar basal-body rod protein FlgG